MVEACRGFCRGGAPAVEGFCKSGKLSPVKPLDIFSLCVWVRMLNLTRAYLKRYTARRGSAPCVWFFIGAEDKLCP